MSDGRYSDGVSVAEDYRGARHDEVVAVGRVCLPLGLELRMQLFGVEQISVDGYLAVAVGVRGDEDFQASMHRGVASPVVPDRCIEDDYRPSGIAQPVSFGELVKLHDILV